MQDLFPELHFCIQRAGLRLWRIYGTDRGLLMHERSLVEWNFHLCLNERTKITTGSLNSKHNLNQTGIRQSVFSAKLGGSYSIGFV